MHRLKFCPIAYNLAFAAETEKVAAAAGQGNVLCMGYSDMQLQCYIVKWLRSCF